MEVNCETIKHLAELSNFSINDAEIKSLENDLGTIIKYISHDRKSVV